MQAIRNGYEQTEVGVIPVDWDVKALGEIANVSMGQSPIGSSYNQNENGIPLINGPTEFTLKYPVKKQWTTEPTKLCKNGDILICVRGSSTGRMNISDGIYCIGRGVAALWAKSNYDSHLLEYLTSNAVNEIISLTSGSTFPNIDGKSLKNILIRIPKLLTEQTSIATALSDADALITSLEKLIAKKRNIKQGAMQELLKPKRGWNSKTLGDCLVRDPDYGINAASVPFSESLPTYLRITDISENGGFLKNDKVSVDNISSSAYYLEEGDIVFARTGASVGKNYLYDGGDGKLVFAGFLIRVKTNKDVLDPRYLFFLTQTKSYWSWVKSNSTRSGQPGLNSSEFKALPIQFPDSKIQHEIISILSDMDSEILTLESKMNKYRQIKSGMMQSLLTGKIRLI